MSAARSRFQYTQQTMQFLLISVFIFAATTLVAGFYFPGEANRPGRSVQDGWAALGIEYDNADLKAKSEVDWSSVSRSIAEVMRIYSQAAGLNEQDREKAVSEASEIHIEGQSLLAVDYIWDRITTFVHPLSEEDTSEFRQALLRVAEINYAEYSHGNDADTFLPHALSGLARGYQNCLLKKGSGCETKLSEKVDKVMDDVGWVNIERVPGE